jgi:transposase
MICRPGMSFTNKRRDGSKPKSLKQSPTTYGLYSESPQAGMKTRRRRSSTAGRCNPLRKAARAGYDGAKRRNGNKVHAAVDTLGHLLALCVTAADEQDRAQVSELARRVQEETGETVQVAFVDQGYTGENAAAAAAAHGIKLEVVKLPTAKRGFVLLPRRWVVERSFGWMSRFRRLARDYERLPETLAGLHYLAFVILMLKNVAEVLA